LAIAKSILRITQKEGKISDHALRSQNMKSLIKVLVAIRKGKSSSARKNQQNTVPNCGIGIEANTEFLLCLG
jgi:hypothetical protein